MRFHIELRIFRMFELKFWLVHSSKTVFPKMGEILKKFKCIENNKFIQYGIITFLYTCIQNFRLRTVYKQRKWPLLAPVRKIMALERENRPLVVK